jgi:putative acetyltransferase
MPIDHSIRSAVPADHDAILTVVREAFSDGDRDGREELDIVVSTWNLAAGVPELELVAIEGGGVVGYVLAAYADLGGQVVVGVAPVAVKPSRQGGGLGSALMTELLRRAELAGLPLMALLGSPAYYGRFGFEPSGPLGITYRPIGESNPHFQVRRFASYVPSLRGDFTYCWEPTGRE